MDKVVIRDADETDMDWVNDQYSKIGFKPSIFESEEILILEVDGQKGAVGRLVRITESLAELGGILVLPEFRGRKFAEQIVGHLLMLPHSYSAIYCLPFSKLESFYKRLGFRDLSKSELAAIPEQIRIKLEWCNCTYKDDTLLLIK